MEPLKISEGDDDITMYKRQLEPALLESEARYRSLFEDSPISLWEEDFSAVKAEIDRLRGEGVADFRHYFENHPEVVGHCVTLVKVTDVNKATLELFKASDTTELLSNLDRIFTPESYHIFREELIAIAECQTVFASEGVNRTLAGEAIHISLNWSVMSGYEDTLSKVIVSLIDITERKRAEAALRESEERFFSAFEYAAIGMALVAPDGHWLKVNRALCELVGYSEEELLTKTFQDITHPDDLEADLAYVRQMLAGEIKTYQIEKRYFHRSGPVVWILLSVSLVRDVQGKPLYFVSQIQDIAKRKRAEEVLQASEERYRSLAEAAHDMIFIINRDNRIEYVNSFAASYFGLQPNEMIGKSTALLFSPQMLDRQRKNLRQVMETFQPIYIEEPTLFPNRDLWLGTWLVPLRNDDGEVHAVLGVARDITERKQAEEHTRRAAARAEALARIAARLNARLDLNAVLNAVCEETARALNAPLTSVMLCDAGGEMLEMAAAFGRPPDSRQPVRPVPRAFYDEQIRRTGPIVVFPDVQALPGQPNADLFGAENIRTLAGAILFREGQLIGSLNVFSVGEERHFTEDELALLKSLADQAAQAIVNARLYADHLRQLESLATLYASAQRLAQSLDPEELAQTVTRACVEVFGARLAWLGRAEPDGQVRALNTHGQMTNVLADLPIRWDETPEGEGPTGRAIRTGFPVVIADIASDPGFALWREAALAGGLCCTGAFPLVSRGKVFGALNLYSDQPGFFTGERVDFFKAYAHQAAIALENARLLAETRRHLQQMQALHTIDVAIAASLDLQFTFKVLLEQVAAQLGVDAAALLLLSPHTRVLEYAAGRGFHTAALQHTRLRLGQGYAGRAALERRIIHIPDWAEEEPDFSRAPLLAEENFRAYYGVPLVAKGYVKGVLEIFHRTPFSPGPEWLTFLEMLTEQAAIAIDNHQLFDGLQRSNLELALAYDATIEGWSYALDLRDKETRDHTRRVTDMTMRLAQTLGMGDAELVHVRRGALLHDIGKMGIPDDILLKAGPLTPEEWEIMRRHPVYAYDMLLPIAYLHPALDIPYCHHEKWEGTGYPRGLKGEQIPLAARIFAVVDVWDALRSDRPYRPAWPDEKVREHIRSLAGTHFDPEVAKVFLEIMSD